jgi:hypothetical protein
MLNGIVALHGGPTPPVTNSYESIATVTVGSGGASSISFSSIPSTYKHLQIRLMSRDAANGGTTAYSATATVRFNGDSGSNYSAHWISASGSGTPGAAGFSSITSIYQAGQGGPYNDQVANVFGAAIIDILDYADTNKYKTTRALNGQDMNGYGSIIFNSGSWRSTSAINAISLFNDGGNWAQYSSAALYGIKG